ncbi:MAG: SDR family oxidoreductase [Bacteroidetes bacterium]|nr:SDR family oxidoreductase [Bacteroidota bacterium]
MKKIILITGATAGIGEATAKIFAEKGYNIIITGRRKERLDKLKTELEKDFDVKVLTLNFDVRNYEQVKSAIASIPSDFREIEILINNAGLAVGLGTIDEGEIDDWDRMVDTNVKGLLYVTREVIPLMKSYGRGHIINIGSIAGKEVYLKGNVYCATKHAVDALSRAMRIDLLPHKIKVTNIAPGAAETEFSLVRYKGDAEKAENVYQGFEPLTAFDIAETVYFAASRPAHVNLNDIVIMPTAQANTGNLLKDI